MTWHFFRAKTGGDRKVVYLVWFQKIVKLDHSCTSRFFCFQKFYVLLQKKSLVKSAINQFHEKKFAIFFNQTSVLKLIVNTNNVSELIRWRKIRWRLFLFDQIPILVFHEFFVFPPLLIILVLGQNSRNSISRNFLSTYYHIDRQDQDESFFYLIKYIPKVSFFWDPSQDMSSSCFLPKKLASNW